jgi:SAM-dependent methyltransferase
MLARLRQRFGWWRPDGLPPFTGEQFIPGRTERRIAEDHLARYEFAASFAAGSRVLDIACGVGYGTSMLADAGAAFVDGVDSAAPIIDHAARLYARPNVRFAVADICAYSPLEPYDVIVCFETIEHVADYEAALRNLWRLLAAGGTLLISSPNRLVTSPAALSISDRPHNPFHFREFTIEEFIAALEVVGFQVRPGAVYGQRQQRAIANRALRRAYTKIFRTKSATHAAVTPVDGRMPRYVLIEAVKTRPAER